MKITSAFPSQQQLHTYWQQLSVEGHSYSELSASADDLPLGYDHDYNRICIGKGESAFEAAKAALAAWQMFPSNWTHIYPPKASLMPDQTVVVSFRLFGLWWHNGCRIIYTIEEADKFGFAYGTLKGHVECGEEQFLVYKDSNAYVWYQITAFSRPAIWLTKLGYPLTRRFQRRFVLDSMALMQQTDHLPSYA